MKARIEKIKNNKVQSLLFVVLVISSLQSCVYYEEPYPQGATNGNAFVRLNWSNREPDYIDANGIVPSNFYWNTYYRTFSGYYTVHYEYDYYSGSHIITDAFDAEVEVWTNWTESSSNNYYSRSVSDNYFDLMLFPDGGYDYDITSSMKSNKEKDAIDTLIQSHNGMTMKIVIKRVEPHKKRIVL